MMKRVVVVGPPGSGKTTTGRAIAGRLGLPYLELDSLWWGPNWTEVGPDIFRQRLDEAVRGETWVVDGNYFSAGGRDIIWPKADTVVWLDHPRWVTVSRVARRTFVRGIRRTELWSGNRESLRRALRRDYIIWFAWREHSKYHQRYEALDADPSLAHLAWIRLRTPRAVRQWLSTLS